MTMHHYRIVIRLKSDPLDCGILYFCTAETVTGAHWKARRAYPGAAIVSTSVERNGQWEKP